MSFHRPPNPIKRYLTCCGFKKNEHMEDLRKELEKILKKINSINDSTSKDALVLEESQRNINYQLERLKSLPDCPCGWPVQRIYLLTKQLSAYF